MMLFRQFLKTINAATDDWIARNGRQRREVKGVWHKRTADYLQRFS